MHTDEIRHVAFAWRWFVRWADAADSRWQAFVDTLKPPLDAGRARGRTFDRQARVDAGLDESFIRELETVTAKRPSGRPR